MPFIITTTTTYPRPGAATPDHNGVYELSRVAVATLENARLIVRDAVVGRDYAADPETVARTLPESGGSVGPLPDGTVIRVEPISWDDVFRVGHPRDQDLPRSRYSDWELVEAFNARVSA